ncbi:hypothetical protein SISNIDRAFT_468211 [Sistotremastrum niveocremeum HHB9708]|uniref:Uncharacterized protein n=1 Tax=Sistotremastrum niveocremeum HHB9708 TaxID=1314777 RepID=A0A164RXM0_9AGAM|nr:hypothetical protein SISNIDRAFT_468211 [Sistotremastrum niveocremeum HHB9708]
MSVYRSTWPEDRLQYLTKRLEGFKDAQDQGKTAAYLAETYAHFDATWPVTSKEDEAYSLALPELQRACDERRAQGKKKIKNPAPNATVARQRKIKDWIYNGVRTAADSKGRRTKAVIPMRKATPKVQAKRHRWQIYSGLYYEKKIQKSYEAHIAQLEATRTANGEAPLTKDEKFAARNAFTLKCLDDETEEVKAEVEELWQAQGEAEAGSEEEEANDHEKSEALRQDSIDILPRTMKSHSNSIFVATNFVGITIYVGRVPRNGNEMSVYITHVDLSASTGKHLADGQKFEDTVPGFKERYIDPILEYAHRCLPETPKENSPATTNASPPTNPSDKTSNQTSSTPPQTIPTPSSNSITASTTQPTPSSGPIQAAQPTQSDAPSSAPPHQPTNNEKEKETDAHTSDRDGAGMGEGDVQEQFDEPGEGGGGEQDGGKDDEEDDDVQDEEEEEEEEEEEPAPRMLTGRALMREREKNIQKWKTILDNIGAKEASAELFNAPPPIEKAKKRPREKAASSEPCRRSSRLSKGNPQEDETLQEKTTSDDEEERHESEPLGDPKENAAKPTSGTRAKEAESAATEAVHSVPQSQPPPQPIRSSPVPSQPPPAAPVPLPSPSVPSPAVPIPSPAASAPLSLPAPPPSAPTPPNSAPFPIDAITVPPDGPQWLVEAVEYLKAIPNPPPQWNSAISGLIELDRSLGFDEQRVRLPTQYRPTHVARWMQLARDFTKHPAGEPNWSLPNLADECEKWWISLFDSLRGSGLPLERTGANAKWWKIVNFGTSNGYFLILLCLSWWADALEDTDVELRARLAVIVDDVAWVSHQLVQYNQSRPPSAKRTHADVEPDNQSPTKRKRRRNNGPNGRIRYGGIDFTPRIKPKPEQPTPAHNRSLTGPGGRGKGDRGRLYNPWRSHMAWVKPEVEDEHRGLEEFKKELGLRGDLLNRYVGRLLGIASSDTGRTKMIVVEAGTVAAYDYLQSLSGFEYFVEHTRIVNIKSFGVYAELTKTQDTDSLGNTEGRGQEGCVWEDWGGWMFGGRIQGGGWRKHFGGTEMVSQILSRGDTFSVNADRTGAASGSFELYAARFQQMREAVTRWSQEKTEENGRVLWNWLRWWSGSNESVQRTSSPSVGDIGWIEGNVWHPISLVHQVPLAGPPRYSIAADRWHDGEWDAIQGTEIGGYTRWSIDVSSSEEEVNLRTFVRAYCTDDILDFFLGSARSLAKDFGIDVHPLRIVSSTGFRVDPSLAILDEQTSFVYYFAYRPNPDGSVRDPPGFWSLCPDPPFSDCHLQVDAAHVHFHIEAFIEYERINNRVLSLLPDLESHGFIPVSDITYAFDPPFASITELSDQHAPDLAISERPKKQFGDALLSVFRKN